MLSQGLIFMFFGMSGVFLFLIILVIAMNLMTILIKYFPGKEEEIISLTATAGGDAEAAAAIAAAYSMKK